MKLFHLPLFLLLFSCTLLPEFLSGQELPEPVDFLKLFSASDTRKSLPGGSSPLEVLFSDSLFDLNFKGSTSALLPQNVTVKSVKYSVNK